MTDTLGLDFIARSLRTTSVVLLIILPFGVYYFGVYPTVAFLSGGIWAIVNLLFLTALVRSAIRPEGADKMRVVGLALVKFPLLYISGYFLLKVTMFEPLHVLGGFSLLLAVVVLKVIARALLGLDNRPKETEHLQGAR